MSGFRSMCAGAFLPGLSFFLALTACGGNENDTSDDETTVQLAPLLGGAPATSEFFDAVGAILAPSMPSHGLCTGTLIEPTMVLTAKHCAMTIQAALSSVEIAFVTGPNALAPRTVHPIVGLEWEESVPANPSLLFGAYGSDVAIAHLATAVEGVTPLSIGRLEADNVGKRFAVIGYGDRHEADDAGLRRAGWMTLGGVGGNYADYAFGGFEGFVVAARDIPKFSAADRESLADIYLQMGLLPQYQAYFGGRRWDAQTCGGDSGAPLIGVRHGIPRVVGIASGGDYPSKRRICDYGSVVAVFGPRARGFIEGVIHTRP